MTHPQDVPAPSPTVSEAMREAVALVLGGALIDAGLGRAIGVVAFDRIAGILLAPAGPIASALAALKRENATLRAERDAWKEQASEEAWALVIAEAELAELATLRAAFRVNILRYAPELTHADIDALLARLRSAALTPKETPDA